ncbi:hypothetical protein C8R47DRAFT_1079044 [Mycena vitilis]|nr:hypothetical protein C8R47DRAFT_1079044 [Mycena vitilis]
MFSSTVITLGLILLLSLGPSPSRKAAPTLSTASVQALDLRQSRACAILPIDSAREFSVYGHQAHLTSISSSENTGRTLQAPGGYVEALRGILVTEGQGHGYPVVDGVRMRIQADNGILDACGGYVRPPQ